MKNILILMILLIFEKSISQNKISTKIKFINVFEFTNVYDYTKEDNDTLMNSKIITKLPENLLRTEKEASIKLLTKLKIIYNNEEHIYIKYLLKRADISNLEIIDIVFANNIFLRDESKNVSLGSVKKILNSVNAKILFEFYNKGDNNLYLEINRLKPFVKSPNGILDINKLADVIEKNKILLSKYLDEL